LRANYLSRFYEFRYIQKNTFNGGDLAAVHILTFRARYGTRYVVNVEEYANGVFVLKFYLQNLAGNENKFKKLTRVFDAGAVLSTCVEIVKSFFQKNPFASFAFVGAWAENEGRGNSKRFRIYKRVVISLISEINFEHHSYPDQSAYLLLNRIAAVNDPDLHLKIEKMFRGLYNFE
jgi:hypothetical protein